MPRLNADWHRANPMPKNPSDEQRIAWHLAHHHNCGCRPLPAGVLVLMRTRGIEPPAPQRERSEH